MRFYFLNLDMVDSASGCLGLDSHLKTFSYLKMMAEGLGILLALPGPQCSSLWEVTKNMACVFKPTGTARNLVLQPH